jgi:glyoxylase-like metal-dependent hydrolase (beta-lactamase superfamily II)
MPPVYEILALRYGTHQARVARANFINIDDHAAPMPLDYYVWAVTGPVGAAAPRTIVVDTGMAAEAVARRPGRTLLAPVEAMLRRAGIDAATVPDVVLTHMHFDHAGSLPLFRDARFHIQDAEMAFCTGRCMCHGVLRAPFDVADVVDAVRLVHGGRMQFHDGSAEIAPGVTLHLIGGHSGGLQVVRVPTARGWVVLASDASHYWANIRTGNPFPIVADVTRVLEGFRTLTALADGPDHIIPGHDPLVRTRFPHWHDDAEIVQLHLPPSG